MAGEVGAAGDSQRGDGSLGDATGDVAVSDGDERLGDGDEGLGDGDEGLGDGDGGLGDGDGGLGDGDGAASGFAAREGDPGLVGAGSEEGVGELVATREMVSRYTAVWVADAQLCSQTDATWARPPAPVPSAAKGTVTHCQEGDTLPTARYADKSTPCAEQQRA